MSTRSPELKEGRDNLGRTIQAVNELIRQRPRPGVTYFPAAEEIPAFACCGLSATSGGVAVAKANGDVIAAGVALQKAILSSTAVVMTHGRINGAITGGAANAPVYTADDGTLTLAPPGGASYVQQVAVCINATDIFVDIQAPVF